MGPKVEACLRFVEAGGTAVIGRLTEVVPAMNGEAGTRIVPQTGAAKKAPRVPDGGAKKAAGKPHGRKADAKKAPAKKTSSKKAASDKTPQPGATVIDIGEARGRLTGGRS
jgi:hypothetical protein